MIHFGDEGGKRNRMTWKLDRAPIGNGKVVDANGRKGLLVDGIMATTHDTDLSNAPDYVDQLPGRPIPG